MTHLARLFCFMTLLQLCISCSGDNFNESDFIAGEAFVNSNIRVVIVDTMTVEVSTIKFDSIITSQAGKVLIGKYTDPVLGTVQSANYAGFLPNSYFIDTEAAYDSIVLFLKYDGYYYNDTTHVNTINVTRLTENFNPDENDDFYNTSSVAYSDDLLGAITYAPRPQSTDSLEIKLTDTLGEEFFNQLQNKSITNDVEFLNTFKGLRLAPGTTDNGSVIGFSKNSDSFFIRLYYSTAEESERVQQYTDLSLNISDSPNPFFNQIGLEEPTEYLIALTNSEISLNSVDSNHQSFIQSGTGIATKIELPYLKTINNIGGKGTLLKAVLKIKPVLGSYNDFLILRDYLSVYLVDGNNDITQQLYSADDTTLSSFLNTENQEYNDIYFEINLTNYVESILTTERNTNTALLLLPENFSSSVDRFILNGQNIANKNTFLELTYAIYDEAN